LFYFYIIEVSSNYSIRLMNLSPPISVYFYFLYNLGKTKYQLNLFILLSSNLSHQCITDEASPHWDTYLRHFHKQPWSSMVLTLCIYNTMEHDLAFLSWKFPDISFTDYFLMGCSSFSSRNYRCWISFLFYLS
jgi:hypothetical protein